MFQILLLLLLFSFGHAQRYLTSLTRDLTIQPTPSALKVWILIYWTTSEVPDIIGLLENLIS